MFRGEDYANQLLGRFDFLMPPSAVPERHADREHLAATQEHEQLHSILARQTTHGLLIMLARSRSWGTGEEEEAEQILDDLLEHGRAAHEAFAIYGTLIAIPQYRHLKATLPDDYLDYLGTAESAVPEPFREKRLGRVCLYATVLVALSPPLPPVEGAPLDVLRRAGFGFGTIGDRWERAISWMARPAAEEDVVAIAREASYTADEIEYDYSFGSLSLPHVFAALAAKERELILRLASRVARDLSLEVTLGQDELAAAIEGYRRRLAPEFRYSTRVHQTLGISGEAFHELHTFFDETVHSDPGFEVITRRNLAKTTDACIRLLNFAATLLPDGCPLVCLLREGSPVPLPEELANQSESPNIEWFAMHPDLEVYRRQKLDSLIGFDIRGLVERLDQLAPPLCVVGSPRLLLSPGTSALLEEMCSAGVEVALLQPLNWMTFLEWREANGLPLQPLRASVLALPGSDFELLSCRFGDEEYRYVRLIGPTGKLGLAEPDRAGLLAEVAADSSAAGPMLAAFLRVYWK